MIITINGNDLDVEVLGPVGAPVLIAHALSGNIVHVLLALVLLQLVLMLIV
jgi:hypothetical protein